jgi:S1-C subfamily serine protease
MGSAAPRRFLLPARVGRVVLPCLHDSLAELDAVPGATADALPHAEPGFAPSFGRAAPPLVLHLGGVGARALPAPAAAEAPVREPVPYRLDGWRGLAVALLAALLLVGAAAWTALQHELAFTRARLAAAEQRLAHEEAQRRTLRAELERRLRGELSGLRAQAGAELGALAARNQQDLAASEAQTRARLDALGAALQHGLADRAVPPGEGAPAPGERGERANLQRVYAQARSALLYIRTTYKVRLERTGEVQEQTAFGTGFLVSPNGVAVTAQHVLFPWRYDRRLQASQALGLAEVLEESAQVTVWLADSRVAPDDSGEGPLLLERAYRGGAGQSGLHVLFVGTPDVRSDLVMTQLGPLPFDLPQLGAGDVAVFQLVEAGRRFPALALEPAPPPAPLDEVLVLGFPLSRLQDGLAVPQVTAGSVRRAGGSILELDAAVHPGNSGGPVLDSAGRVVGMASAILDSPVYGLALPAPALRAAVRSAREATAALQRRVLAAGCDPGALDGSPGPRTWSAETCAAALAAGL